MIRILARGAALGAEAQRLASPRQVLLNVHRLLLEMSRAEIFVTVFYGVLDPERGTLHYARAGHDYPLLYRPEAGRFRSLTATGMPLGLVEEIIVEEAVTDLSPGELVVLYTDGIIHAESAAGEFFGAERLRDTVVAGAALGPQATCDRVFECVDSFQTGAGQFDDMALLVVSVEDSG